MIQPAEPPEQAAQPAEPPLTEPSLVETPSTETFLAVATMAILETPVIREIQVIPAIMVIRETPEIPAATPITAIPEAILTTVTSEPMTAPTPEIQR